MSTQPEALRLADQLEGEWTQVVHMMQAADELRRLHGINQDLLEALETIVSTERDRHGYHPAWTDQARAATAKARGEK
jgi:hypothetical protein